MRRLLKEAYHAYDARLRSKPLPVKMVTSGIIVCASDVCVQLYQASKVKEKDCSNIAYSPWRTLVVGVGYGALWFAPVLHAITTTWARMLPSATIPSLATKLVVDMTTSFPVNVSVMLAAQAVARGEADIRGAVERNVVASVMDGWKFWTPATLIMCVSSSVCCTVLYGSAIPLHGPLYILTLVLLAPNIHPSLSLCLSLSLTMIDSPYAPSSHM